MAEMGIAQNTALLANVNRDPKHTPQPFKPSDFCLFRQEEEEDSNAFPANAAAVALALRNEGHLPEVLIGAWQAVLQVAPKATTVPEVRAFRSDDGAITLLAPVAEGRNWRGVLCVNQARYGSMVLRDIDRPLHSYTFKLPEHKHYSYVEAGVLLVVAPRAQSV